MITCLILQKFDTDEDIKDDDEEKLTHLAMNLIDCHNVSIDVAIMLGKNVVKIFLKKKPLEFEEWIIDHIDSRKTNFGKLCLIMGSLNHGPNSANFHDRLFDDILTCCSSTTSHDFQSFQALKLWSAKAKLSESQILTPDNSDNLQRLLNLINSNWGNPLKGITDLLTETLQNVLQIVNSPQVDNELLEKTLKCLSWKTR